MSEKTFITGVCRWFSLKKGYGFVNPDGTQDVDIFVHHTNLKADGFALLRAGQRVRFTVGKDSKEKDTALEVTAEDGSLLKPDQNPNRPRRKSTTGRQPKKAPETESTEVVAEPKEQPAKKRKPKRKPKRRPRVRFVETPQIKEVKNAAISAFQQAYSKAPTHAAYASGRVNLIGEHIDYNDGLVMPFSIHLGTCVVGHVREDENGPHVRVTSTNVKDDNSQSFEVDDKLVQAKWVNYIKGVVYFFHTEVAKVPKLDIAISSTVPLGSGLSSSASLEVAVCTFLETITGTLCADGTTKASLCVKAEHVFAKVPCGIMDQTIAVRGRAGHVLLLDCRTKKPTHVPFETQGSVSLVVINSKVSHSLADGEYAKRKAQCVEGLELLKKTNTTLTSLRDATVEEVDALENQDSLPVKRVRHVVGEIKRVEDCVKALKQNDFNTVGRLMYESHYALKDLYEVSCKELDILVELAKAQEGVYGSRMTGGGFGGCTITLCSETRASEVLKAVTQQYQEKTGIAPDGFVTTPAFGTRSLRVGGPSKGRSAAVTTAA